MKTKPTVHQRFTPDGRMYLIAHQPRHQYDCERCKFHWCCGPLCACWSDWPTPPPKLARKVAKLQSEWRVSVGLQA